MGGLKYTEVRRLLEAELERLRQKTGEGSELEVLWEPHPDSAREGEVKGNLILIYSETPEKALETLRHEYVEWLLNAKIARPYRLLINKLIEAYEQTPYRQQEQATEAILKLLNQTPILTNKENCKPPKCLQKIGDRAVKSN